jgi:hypothetical protein
MHPSELAKFAETLRLPSGTIYLRDFTSDGFKSDANDGIMLEVPSDGHYLLLDRIDGRRIRFFHSSPGSGTRVATLDLAPYPEFDTADIFMMWSPTETKLVCGSRSGGCELLTAVGEPSPVSIRVGANGQVFAFGGFGSPVAGARVRIQGVQVLKPTAIEHWKETLHAVEVLWAGKPTGGDMHEILLANLTISMLVTGLEGYAKTRLLEIEKEGHKPCARALFDEFARKRGDADFARLEHPPTGSRTTLFHRVLDDLEINFQDLDKIKNSYKKAFRIMIGEIGIQAADLIDLKKYIAYRHRVIHASPLLGVLNEENVPPEEPMFANKRLADKAVLTFDVVIKALHDATLNLKAG